MSTVEDISDTKTNKKSKWVEIGFELSSACVCAPGEILWAKRFLNNWKNRCTLVFKFEWIAVCPVVNKYLFSFLPECIKLYINSDLTLFLLFIFSVSLCTFTFVYFLGFSPLLQQCMIFLLNAFDCFFLVIAKSAEYNFLLRLYWKAKGVGSSSYLLTRTQLPLFSRGYSTATIWEVLHLPFSLSFNMNVLMDIRGGMISWSRC